MTPRYFLRTPCFDTRDEAIAWAESVGAITTVIHRSQSVPLVGVAEIPAPESAHE